MPETDSGTAPRLLAVAQLARARAVAVLAHGGVATEEAAGLEGPYTRTVALEALACAATERARRRSILGGFLVVSHSVSPVQCRAAADTSKRHDKNAAQPRTPFMSAAGPHRNLPAGEGDGIARPGCASPVQRGLLGRGQLETAYRKVGMRIETEPMALLRYRFGRRKLWTVRRESVE